LNQRAGRSQGGHLFAVDTNSTSREPFAIRVVTYRRVQPSNKAGELLPAPSDSSESKAATTALTATLKQNLADLVESDDRGRPRLTFALPDATALDGLTNVLARLLVRTQSANGL